MGSWSLRGDPSDASTMVYQFTKKLPGILAALVVALLAGPLARWLGSLLLWIQGIDPAGHSSPLSAIPVAVLMGVCLSNTVGTPASLKEGLDLVTHIFLRLGIVLVGLKLSLLDVLRVGAVGVPIVIVLVMLALVGALMLARLTGVGSRMATLAATSTAICGITATLAIAPGIEADEREVAYTVANVTLFGLVAMLFYPWLAHTLLGTAPGAAGLFLGTAIHDTSQVMGAAITYKEIYADEKVLQVATVAKLTRNSLLVVIVPLMTWLHRRTYPVGGKATTLWSLLPLFVLGFLALSGIRTVGEVGLAGGGLAWGVWSESTWRSLISTWGEGVATLTLAAALAAVGMKTRFSILRGMGLGPFVVGLGSALLVGAASLMLSWWVGPFLP